MISVFIWLSITSYKRLREHVILGECRDDAAFSRTLAIYWPLGGAQVQKGC